jgi:hypothetical protein
MKRSIGLANSINTTENAPLLKESTKRAIENVVDRCRVQRKRARALETPKDVSDEAICRAAKWTDRLPLLDYENVLHLCPRLVNVVTVRNARLYSHCVRHYSSTSVCVFGSLQRPSPWRDQDSSCRSICIGLALDALMRTMRPVVSRRSNWHSTPRAAVSSCFVRYMQFEPNRRTHIYHEHLPHNTFKTSPHPPTCASHLPAQIPAGLSELVRCLSYFCTCSF